MLRLRRRRPDPALRGVRDAFGAAAEEVERAQRALLAAMPAARGEGVPLAQALASFAGHLRAAEERMDDWRDDRVAREWTRCRDAVAEAGGAAEALRLGAPPTDLETLSARVGDVLHPLGAFADVERALRSGRSSSG